MDTKSCLMCVYCAYSQGEDHLSEQTPGADASLHCEREVMRHVGGLNLFTHLQTRNRLREALATATTCPDYRVDPMLRETADDAPSDVDRTFTRRRDWDCPTCYASGAVDSDGRIPALRKESAPLIVDRADGVRVFGGITCAVCGSKFNIEKTDNMAAFLA